MSKLGYTFYFDQWNGSERVLELTLSERAVYRELIDRAYKNDNVIAYKPNIWSRIWNASKDEIESIVKRLFDLNLIMKNDDNTLCLPECESRLNHIRNGKKGGAPKGNNNAKKAPKQPPKTTPENNLKQPPKTTKVKRKEKEKEKERKRKQINGVPISPELILEYFKKIDSSRNPKIESAKFWDHYESNGWKVGKNAMKDWHSTARNWVRRYQDSEPIIKSNDPPPYKMGQR